VYFLQHTFFYFSILSSLSVFFFLFFSFFVLHNTYKSYLDGPRPYVTQGMCDRSWTPVINQGCTASFPHVIHVIHQFPLNGSAFFPEKRKRTLPPPPLPKVCTLFCSVIHGRGGGTMLAASFSVSMAIIYIIILGITMCPQHEEKENRVGIIKPRGYYWS